MSLVLFISFKFRRELGPNCPLSLTGSCTSVPLDGRRRVGIELQIYLSACPQLAGPQDLYSVGV